METKDLTLADVSAFTEEKALAYFEAIRWPNGPICAHCGSVNVVRLKGKSTRLGTLKCRDCRKPFAVKVGTIMQASHLTYRQWAIAFHMICSSKKGYSAKQLQRNLGIKAYKPAWHMAHRIRHAMQQGPFRELLDGIVEVDETYIGPKVRGRGVYEGKRRKAPVVSLVERNGKARSFHVANVTANNLRPILKEHISKQASLMTDDFSTYVVLGKDFASHDVVNHTAGVYSRRKGDKLVTTNTVEGYFSILKRGVYGTFHHVSKEHLHRYLSEFDFRYNARKISDGERAELAIKGADGKRLMYG